MKWLPLIAILLSGCALKANWQPYQKPSRTMLPTEVYQKLSSPCYETTHGLKIRKYDSECPPKELLEEHTRRLFTRLGAPDYSLEGTEVVFVRGGMFCGRWRAVGCAYVTRKELTVRYAGPFFSWGDTFVHELGHQILHEAEMDPDAMHYDEEFIRAVEAINVKKYMLRNTTWNNAFLKLWSKE